MIKRIRYKPEVDKSVKIKTPSEEGAVLVYFPVQYFMIPHGGYFNETTLSCMWENSQTRKENDRG